MRMLAIVMIFLSSAAQATTVEILVEGLRSDQGNLAASLFNEESRQAFPRDGKKAQESKYLKIKSKNTARLVFENVPKGNYALSLMHDENADGKMNMAMGIPREGFGFSNNPTIYFGPPSFSKAQFAVEGESITVTVKLKYML